jgi:hypothetical protein
VILKRNGGVSRPRRRCVHCCQLFPTASVASALQSGRMQRPLRVIVWSQLACRATSSPVKLRKPFVAAAECCHALAHPGPCTLQARKVEEYWNKQSKQGGQTKCVCGSCALQRLPQSAHHAVCCVVRVWSMCAVHLPACPPADLHKSCLLVPCRRFVWGKKIQRDLMMGKDVREFTAAALDRKHEERMVSVRARACAQPPDPQQRQHATGNCCMRAASYLHPEVCACCCSATRIIS